MSKKKEQVTETPAPVYDTPKKPLITRHVWKEQLFVFRCEECGQFRNNRDRLVEHVLTHFPPEEQGGVLDELLKEK